MPRYRTPPDYTLLRRAKTRARLSGFSLVEMLIVIVLAGLFMGIVVTSLVSLARFHQLSQRRSQERAGIDRLTDALRNDLRLASELRRDGNDVLVIVTAADAVRYTLADEVCVRIVVPNSGDQERRDAFTVGPTREWRIEEPLPQRATRSVWLVRAAREEGQAVLPAIHVVAAIDANRRKTPSLLEAD